MCYSPPPMRTSVLLGGVWLAAALGCSAGSSPKTHAGVDAGLADAGGDAGSASGPVPDGGPMGGTLVPGGAEFRVWAPNATAATAIGDFGSQALTALGDGTYVGFVAGATAGQQYHFELQSGGQTLERTDPRVQETGVDPGRQEPAGYLYDQTAYAWQSAPFVPPPLNQAVIYELHVGTFVDPSGTGAGTYQSAATKLADLAQLGVNMVELMPVTEFPGGYSWGYSPLYAFAPAHLYGAPDDLKAFVDQAHQAGLGVILDVVFNHFQLDSQTTPSLSMWCFDGPCSGGGIYFSPEPSTPWGPRPAFGAGPVAAMIKDAIASWRLDYRVDGFRWDSVIAIRNTSLDGTGTEIHEGAELVKNANVALHALNPGALSIAEDLQGWSAITTPVDPTAIDTYDSGYGFDTQWDDGFDFTVKPLLTATADADRDVTQLAGEPLTAGPPMQRVVFTEDHDQVAPQNGADNQRIPELIGLSDNGYYAEKRSSLGIALVMTAPAVPMLFMGQEFLTTLPFPFSPAQAIDWTNEQTYAGFRHAGARLDRPAQERRRHHRRPRRKQHRGPRGRERPQRHAEPGHRLPPLGQRRPGRRRGGRRELLQPDTGAAHRPARVRRLARPLQQRRPELLARLRRHALHRRPGHPGPQGQPGAIGHRELRAVQRGDPVAVRALPPRNHPG